MSLQEGIGRSGREPRADGLTVRGLRFFGQKLTGLASEQARQFAVAFTRFGGNGMTRPALLFGSSARVVTVI